MGKWRIIDDECISQITSLVNKDIWKVHWDRDQRTELLLLLTEVLDYLMPSWGEEVTLSGCHMTELLPVRTCEDVLAQSRRTAIFAVVEVLRGGGALEVLHGQTVTQDVLLQVRTGPKLSITNIRLNRKCLQEMMLSHFKRTPSGLQYYTTEEQSTASVLSICRLDLMWGVFCFLFLQ